MRHFLAIDGGNSKTDVVVGAEDGRILALVRGPGSSPHNLAIEGSVATLDALSRDALRIAGVDADLLVACLAGIDLPTERARYVTVVNETAWATDSVVDNDLFGLLRAGTSDPNAIAVVCGAGINCVGRRADGRTARFPALGPLSGDWGGGGHLAQVALWHAARGEDGRGPATALSRAIAAHFGQVTVEDVAAAIHLGDIPESRTTDLTPLLFDIAESGDVVARRVILRQAREIVTLARVAGERLNLLGRQHTMVLGGGLIAARRQSLLIPVMRGLADVAPKATIKIVSEHPVTGAALLALDRLGTVTPEIEATLRSAIAERLAGPSEDASG